MKKVSVLLAMNTPRAYDYSISNSLEVKLGDFVKVPFIKFHNWLSFYLFLFYCKWEGGIKRKYLP